MQNVQTISPSESPLLRISELSKCFGATQALSKVSLQVAAGEIHCVLGENGAGKSTIGKIVSGLYSADEGSIWFDEKPVAFSSSREARTAGIVMVYQELSLAPSLSVRANLWLGAERGRSLLSFTRRRQEQDRAGEVLQQLGLADIDMEIAVSAYPVAIQQLIEIGKSLMSDPKVIIFDEPTAMLGAVEKEKFFAVLRRLRTDGIALMLVTHHIDDVLAVSDRVTIMRNGQVVDAFAIGQETSPDFIVSRLTGKPPGSHRFAHKGGKSFPPLLDFENLPVSEGGNRVFSVGRGEILGIYGVVGCGGDRLLQNLVGFIPTPREASVRFQLDGYPWRPTSVVAALKGGVAWLPAGRSSNGVYPTLSIADNLMMTQLRNFSHGGFIHTGKSDMRAGEILQACGVKFGNQCDLLTSLSGGNQQKVLLARAMASASKLLVLEEPTAGVDLGAKHEIHQRIRALAATGVSVIMLSSDLAETLSLCDTVWTLFHGAVVNTYHSPDEHDKAAIIADVVGQLASDDDLYSSRNRVNQESK